jgi:alginate O-acetyltransferase complex protein AlgI
MSFVPIYILILGFTILIDYISGIYIGNNQGKKRKLYLILSLISNISVLAIFKYYNFLNENLTSFLSGFAYPNPIPYLSIALPIGLSFHTFQSMSYTIEVYRGNQTPERHIGMFALYVMFYPQLVAGPIERPQNLLHQFYKEHRFDYKHVVEGLKMMLWGFFKKLVIADRLAIYVNSIYNNIDDHNGSSLILATIFFSFQIYCDFSGYSDIAIGAAKVMGFDLITNFKRPILAKSTGEHWKRWHISLSSWFKDYLYFPLGGSRVSTIRLYYNLMVVFVLSGLWHGADWTFIIWGGINGAYLVFAIITKKYSDKFNSLIGINQFPRFKLFYQILTTFILITFSRIFFRSNSLSDALIIIKKIFTERGEIYIENPSILIFSFLGIFILLFVELKQEYYKGHFSFFNNENWVIRNISYAILIILIFLIGVFDGGQFIYFQF